MKNKDDEKKYNLYVIFGIAIVTISIILALQFKNVVVGIIAIIASILLVAFLLMYRKSHDIAGKDERQRRISQMAGNSTFVVFFLAFMLTGAINVFYSLENILGIYTLPSVLSGIGFAMLYCFLIFYLYYKHKY